MICQVTFKPNLECHIDNGYFFDMKLFKGILEFGVSHIYLNDAIDVDHPKKSIHILEATNYIKFTFFRCKTHKFMKIEPN